MDKKKKSETTRLIEDACGSDFDGTLKRTNSTQETIIHQTDAASLVQSQKEPAKKFRTSSFWIAETCARLNVAGAESRSDETEPHITGMTFLKDGQLIVCDNNNRTIKLFNRDLIMTCELYVDAKPFDVATVDEELALVSFPDSGMLRYIIVKPGLKPGRRIQINETCLGITVRKSQIYVCIKEDKISAKMKDTFNGIIVFSMKGKPIYSIPHKGFGYAKYVCVSGDGRKIFYTGGEEKDAVVVCVTKDGHGVFRYADDMLQSPVGIALDRNGNLVIGDLVNGVLYVVNSDGAKRKYLSDLENRSKISSLAFSAEAGKLVVCRCTTLTAYYLLKPNSSGKGNIELSYSGTNEKAKRKCCVLL